MRSAALRIACLAGAAVLAPGLDAVAQQPASQPPAVVVEKIETRQANNAAQFTARVEAIEAVDKRRPGLVLADIQLADGSSGLDAVNEILESFSVPVVFITAYPERLLTGERPEPTFLITKPFQPETVKAAIGQALFFHPTRRREAISA